MLHPAATQLGSSRGFDQNSNEFEFANCIRHEMAMSQGPGTAGNAAACCEPFLPDLEVITNDAENAAQKPRNTAQRRQHGTVGCECPVADVQLHTQTCRHLSWATQKCSRQDIQTALSLRGCLRAP